MKMSCAKNGHSLIVCLLLLFSISPLHAQSAAKHKTILILCDALSFNDLLDKEFPSLQNFSEQSAIGLMNCFVEGEKTPLNAYLSLAYGVHTPPHPNGTDLPTLQGRQITFPSVPQRAYQTANSLPFGTVLRKAHTELQIELYGDGDTDALGKRAALFIVDENGVGESVAEPNRTDKNAPFGKIDNPLALSQMVQETIADIVVITLGDTARLEAMRGSLTSAAYAQARKNALRRLNILLLMLTEVSKADADILLVSAYPPKESTWITGYWQRLTPIVAYGKHFRPGLLTSPTTRTKGLVANIDVTPTLLTLLGVEPPPSMSGRAISVSPYNSDAAQRLALLNRLDFVSQLNLQALFYITAPLFFLTVLGIAIALIAHKRGSQRAGLLSVVFVCAVNAPSALMLAPLLVPPTLLEYGLRIGFWMFALCVPAYLLSRWLKVSPFLAAVFLNLAIVAADLCTGQNLMKESYVTNSALVGVRYYGIGNEYLGMMMGFALMGGFAWMEERKQRAGGVYPKPFAVIGAWTLCLLLFGLPKLGANAGSFVVSCAGFGMGTLLLYGKPPKVRYLFAFMLLGLLLAFGVSALDSRLSNEGASHIGTALHTAKQGGGVSSLTEIIKRKLALNWRTLFSMWILIIAGGTSLTFWGFYRLQREAFDRLFRAFPLLQKGVYAVLSASVASLLFKDTGAMTAVLMLTASALVLLWYTTQAPACNE